MLGMRRAASNTHASVTHAPLEIRGRGLNSTSADPGYTHLLLCGGDFFGVCGANRG